MREKGVIGESHELQVGVIAVILEIHMLEGGQIGKENREFVYFAVVEDIQLKYKKVEYRGSDYGLYCQII